jgi:hypothetical protein
VCDGYLGREPIGGGLEVLYRICKYVECCVVVGVEGEVVVDAASVADGMVEEDADGASSEGVCK